MEYATVRAAARAARPELRPDAPNGPRRKGSVVHRAAAVAAVAARATLPAAFAASLAAAALAALGELGPLLLGQHPLQGPGRAVLDGL
ncbi:MAG: hypothetical protein ACK5Z4_16390, partial [Planctomyces sp.]